MSSSAKDKSLSHPSAPKHVVAEMHKEAQQAAGVLTSLGVTSEAHPQLSSGMSAFINIEPVHLASFTFYSESALGNDVSADFTAEVDPGKFAPNDSIPHQHGMEEGTKNYAPSHTFARTNPGTNKESRSDDISKKIKLEDLSDLMINQDDETIIVTDSPNDEPIIVTDESKEEEAKKHKKAHATSYNEPEDTLASHLPYLKLVQLQELKDQVAELKTLKLKLLAEFLALPSQISSVQAKLQTLDTLPSLLNKVANTLTRFASIIENASHTAKSKGVPSAGPTTNLPAEGEKNTNQTAKDAKTTNLHDELVDFLGIYIVTQYYNKKLLYDK
nr:hypothetical protein [Tanacetum cinerariifolium]GEX54197.1 hypothetical protein [Tanacetum cinerariifolium]GEX54204.1 hypothetical protein [Tanacetum cinerariifolium]